MNLACRGLGAASAHRLLRDCTGGPPADEAVESETWESGGGAGGMTDDEDVLLAAGGDETDDGAEPDVEPPIETCSRGSLSPRLDRDGGIDTESPDEDGAPVFADEELDPPPADERAVGGIRELDDEVVSADLEAWRGESFASRGAAPGGYPADDVDDPVGGPAAGGAAEGGAAEGGAAEGGAAEGGDVDDGTDGGIPADEPDGPTGALNRATLPVAGEASAGGAVGGAPGGPTPLLGETANCRLHWGHAAIWPTSSSGALSSIWQ